MASSASPTVFLLSPANLGGKRGKMLLGEAQSAELARRIRSPGGAPLGEVFSFVSGLYFRGKVSYAQAFGTAVPGAWVITAGGGLCSLDEPITLARLRDWAAVTVAHDNPHFTAPLVRHAAALLDQSDPATRFVLLGSVATAKYLLPLRVVLAGRLYYPSAFVGLGDMSRGSLMLKAVREQRELDYQQAT